MTLNLTPEEVQDIFNILGDLPTKTGAYRLYIGRRNNASFPFTGQLYNLIIASRTLSSGQITQVERYVAGKTGITI